jgi:hypothetical protein
MPATDDRASFSGSDHASSPFGPGPGRPLARNPTGRVGRRMAAVSRTMEHQASTPALTQTA